MVKNDGQNVRRIVQIISAPPKAIVRGRMFNRDEFGTILDERLACYGFTEGAHAIICLALMEDPSGERRVEPMIWDKGIRLACDVFDEVSAIIP